MFQNEIVHYISFTWPGGTTGIKRQVCLQIAKEQWKQRLNILNIYADEYQMNG